MQLALLRAFALQKDPEKQKKKSINQKLREETP